MSYAYFPPSPAPDILKGAAAIAEFLFGAKGRRREIYYLVERDSLPHFKLGSMICARPATLEAWIAKQEAISISQKKEPA